MNKLIKILLVTVFFSLLPVADLFALSKEATEVIAIIHTNDVHGHIDVEPYVKGLADELKASGDYSLVLTVSAGDVYTGGHAVAGYYNGELIPAIEDQVYDVIVPGNNDFPSGIPSNVLLTSLYNNTKTICANVQVKEDTDMAAYAAGYTARPVYSPAGPLNAPVVASESVKVTNSSRDIPLGADSDR